ncbi:hypothetical protein [Luteibacter yeojuensis]|uniref:hypothetical protein n=1 Tax=Luteibacter yeojuensis TaxID=345309 RepID=UPI000B0D17E4|nr:hypothetical protein [Luteibacter yeojuensis]
MTETTKLRRSSLAIAVVTTLVAACSSHIGAPDIQENPAPSKTYVLLVKLDGAPAAFDKMSGRVFYEVTNDLCAPAQAISGVHDAPRRDIPVTLTKQADGTYTAKFVGDPYLDSDYFGKGTCHWGINAVTVVATKDKRTFIASIGTADLTAESVSRLYFAKSAFENANDPLKVVGLRNPEVFAPGTEKFTINMTAKEATHDPDNR